MDSDSDEVMDPSVWGKLYSDLHDSVLAKLPLRSFCQFRTVCKRWNSFDPKGLKIFVDAPLEHPCFIIFKPQRDEIEIQPPVYGCSLERWHRTIRLREWPYPQFHGLYMASDGGLICCNNRIYNPVTGACRSLPPISPDTPLIDVVCLVVDRAPQRYRVFAITRRFIQGLWSNRLDVFHSETSSWHGAGNLAFRPGVFNMSEGVYLNGCLYVAVYTSFVGSLTLISYEGASGKKRAFSQVPRYISKVNLVQWRDSIFLIMGKSCIGRFTSEICVYEVQVAAVNCVLVGTMDDRLLNFEAIDIGKYYNLSACGNLVMFVFDIVGVSERIFNRHILFDLNTRGWSEVPGSEMDVVDNGGHYRSAITFCLGYKPRLTGSV